MSGDVAAYIGSVLVDVCMSHCSWVDSLALASTKSELPEDGVTTPKHVGTTLM